MPRKAPLVFAFALVTAALGVALYAAAKAPMPEPSAPAGPRPGAEDRGPAPAPLAGGSDVENALKRLDLIRPSRVKYAEDFTLPQPDGKSFRLADQRGKVVLVNFWATWCPPCLEEMPAMERLWRRHKDDGFVLLAISLDADPKKVSPFVSARKFTFPVAVDPKMAVAEKYGVRALPSSFVIDRAGALTGVALGPRAWDDAAAHGLLQAMLR
ncbi:MAG TPA: TlpA disulfide reductase family protein [Methylomirabilota bacterium]|jgi:peroxiredoxin|nr:TlpA disulfide reductase family protein [Methylomirabilota bacterium]